MNLDKKKIPLIISCLFALFGVLLILAGTVSPQDIIKISLKNKEFSGSLPAFLFTLSALFAWVGITQTKGEMIQEITDSFQAVKETYEGAIGTLHYRFGPDEMVPEFKKLLNSGNLKGTYVIKKLGKILNKGNLDLYVDPNSKAIMAHVNDVPLKPDTLIELTLKANAQTWRTSESVRVRIAGMDFQGE